MIQIKLSGGVYDGKVVEISEEMFHAGYLDMFPPLPPENLEYYPDVDIFNIELEILRYARTTDEYVWRIV